MSRRSGWISVLQEMRARVSHWRLTGPDGSRLAVFGAPSAMHTYRREFFGSDECGVKSERFIHWTGWRAAVAHERQSCAMVVINGCLPPIEHAAEAIACPRFLQVAVQVPESMESYRKSLGSHALRDVRKMRSSCLSSLAIRDSGWIPEFLRDFHEPSVRGSYGESSLVESPTVMRAGIANGTGEFVCVRREAEPLAACYCSREGEVYFARSLGWKDGGEEPLRIGAVSALYWFIVERAMQLGCTTVRLGGVPPNLSDGLLQFKAKWGACFVPEWSHSPVDHLLLNDALPGWRRFMDGHDLLAWGAGRTLEVHSIRAPDEIKVRPHVKAAIARWHRIGIPVDAGP